MAGELALDPEAGKTFPDHLCFCDFFCFCQRTDIHADSVIGDFVCVCAFLYLSSFFKNYIHTFFIKTTESKRCLCFVCRSVKYI